MTTHEAEQQLSIMIFCAVADKKETITIPLPLAVELDIIAQTLSRIENKTKEQTIKKETNYLEKDDNYYMI